MIYVNVSKMCNFVMHRGLIIATIQLYFIVIFFFIDMPIFNGFLTFGYSTIFTNLPVIAIIMDEDLSFQMVRQYPQLYRELQQGRLLNYRKFFELLMKGIFQGSVIMLLTIILFPTDTLDIVTITFTALILTELLNTVTIVSRVTVVLLCTLAVSMLMYFLTLVYLREYINVASINGLFLAKVLLIVAASWGIIFLLKLTKERIWPSYTQRVLRDAPPFESTYHHNDMVNRISTFKFESEFEEEEDENPKQQDRLPLL